MDAMTLADYCLIACKVVCVILALAAVYGTIHATHIAAYKRGVADGVRLRKSEEKCHCTECWLRDNTDETMRDHPKEKPPCPR